MSSECILAWRCSWQCWCLTTPSSSVQSWTYSRLLSSSVPAIGSMDPVTLNKIKHLLTINEWMLLTWSVAQGSFILSNFSQGHWLHQSPRYSASIHTMIMKRKHMHTHSQTYTLHSIPSACPFKDNLNQIPWSQSQLILGKRHGTHWADHWSIAGLLVNLFYSI